MNGKFVNVSSPSAVIHTFVLKWYMRRVPDRITIKEYISTVNTSTENANKFLLQIENNK